MIVHAIGESVAKPHPTGLHAVVLAGEPQQLAELKERLQAAHVPHKPIFEPDPPFFGELLAIGITPASKEALRRHVSSLPLLK